MSQEEDKGAGEVTFRTWPDGRNATVLRNGKPFGRISWGPDGRTWKPPSSQTSFDVTLVQAIVTELESKG